MILNDLCKTGRAVEIIRYLDIISNWRNHSDCPVHPFVNENGECQTHIPWEKAKDEADYLLKSLYSNTINTEEYTYLERYVGDYLDMQLHNYANEISHRREPDPQNMEMIRMLSIIWDLLMNGDDPDWGERIPKGWCKS